MRARRGGPARPGGGPLEACLLGAAAAAQVLLLGGPAAGAAAAGLLSAGLSRAARRRAEVGTFLAIAGFGGLAMLLGARLDAALWGRPAHVHGALTLPSLLGASTAAMLLVCLAYQPATGDRHCPAGPVARPLVCAGMLAGMWAGGEALVPVLHRFVSSHETAMHLGMILGMAAGHVAAGRLVAALLSAPAARDAAHEMN